METEIKMKKTTDNISSLRNGLNSLIKRTTENEIVMKPADKGSIITVMSPEFYLNMCESHLRNEEYYECIQDNDPSPLLKNKIIAYAKKYQNLPTENEYKTLTQKTYKISNFYMLPKLHKSKELNDIILAKNSEYINVDKILTIEGRPIVAGPCYHTSVVSQILHVIMETTLSFIKHILKDSFDFIDRIDTQCTVNTILSTCDIKSLYTNIKHDVFYKAIEYWIDKFHDDIPYINKNFFHQIKGTAMGTIFAVVVSNLTVAYFEVKMFALLPQIYPRDFVDYFVRNYFRFLDDIFHTWLINSDIEPFYKLLNELDPGLKFIFEKLTTDINFLDIIIKIVDNQLHFDIYHKPTNSFSYLKYNSCHPSHTKNNISLSLARRIIRIVTDNRDYRLEELRKNILKRNHPEKIINYSFTKNFQPKNNKEENKEIITFTRTYNPNHNFNYNRFNNCLNNINNRELRETFSNKKVLLTTRQPKNLKSLIYIRNYRIENPMDCSPARIASTIKMAILNHANHLPLNLQMGNLLPGITISFLIVIVKMFYIY